MLKPHLSSLALVTASLFSAPLITAQTTATCHITPFTAPSGSGFARLNTAVTINRNNVAVGADVNGKPYVRYSNGTIQPLNIHEPGAFVTVGKRNDYAITVGSYQNGNPVMGHGFINNGTATTTYNYPGAVVTAIAGVNRYGTKVGNFYGAPSGNGMFILKNGNVTVLNPPAKFSREPQVTAISDTGVIVGTYALQNSPPDPDQTTHGFILANGVWKDFVYPGRLDTYIEDINASGEMVGLLDDGSPNYAFIYKNGKFYQPTFVLPNGSKTKNYTSVVGLSSNGLISGNIQVSLTPTPTYKPYVGSCTFQ
jgi:hypothetical protein